MALRYTSRPGARGGQGDFKWEDVKTDKYRENYLVCGGVVVWYWFLACCRLVSAGAGCACLLWQFCRSSFSICICCDWRVFVLSWFLYVNPCVFRVMVGSLYGCVFRTLPRSAFNSANWNLWATPASNPLSIYILFPIGDNVFQKKPHWITMNLN